MKTTDLIVVQYFYDITELALAKNQLEQAGIFTQERDVQTLSTLSALEARSVGGAKLLVFKKDYQKASKLLIQGGFMTYNANPTHFLWEETLQKWVSILPGTANLSKELRLVLAGFILLSLIFSILLLFLLNSQ